MTEREMALRIPCPWCPAPAGEECQPLPLDLPDRWPGVHAGRIVRALAPGLLPDDPDARPDRP